MKPYKTELLLLSLILALAAFFRFYRLDSLPPGLYPDVAINGNEAISNPGRVFYPENNGREGLFINLVSLSFALFGISIWSIKAVAAFFGTLTVLGTYLLCQELFQREQSKNSGVELGNRQEKSSQGVAFPSISLLASFFLASSFWHINFSRIGFRAILLPFTLVFSFYLLLRGFRKKNVSEFVWGGILFGLGFYTYTSFRLAILILFFVLTAQWLFFRTRGEQKKVLLFAGVLLYFTFITALPIGFYFLLNPADFAARAAPISVFSQEKPLQAFLESLTRHLAMFNISGDPNWRHNFAAAPQLFWPVGILFLVGVALAIKEMVSNLSPAARRMRSNSAGKTLLSSLEYHNVFPYALLSVWLFTMLLPGALTYEGIPHALRTIGVLPVPYIFAAIGAVTVYNVLLQKIKNKKIVTPIAVLFLVSVALSGYYDYFIKWARNPNVRGAFTVSYVKIGEYLTSLPPEMRKYVIVNEPGVPVPFPDGIPMPAQTPMFIERTKYYEPLAIYIKPDEINKIDSRWKPVIIPMKYDEELARQLKNAFPEGQERIENGVWVFKTME